MPNPKIAKPSVAPRVRLPFLYRERGGRLYCTKCEDFLASKNAERLVGKVNLIFTSPPFPLNRKKAYGNLDGEAYVEWLSALAPELAKLLTPAGSIVLEIGNGWRERSPTMSTLAVEALLRFKQRGNLNLIQEFVCHNPARLPGPAQWVNIERIRVTDSFTHVWWMSLNERPFADNRCVLRPYSHSMAKLLATKKYNSGKRPSEHHIGKTSFLTNNAGAIPSNVLTFSNTRATDTYQEYCRLNEIKPHPARMQPELPDFFIKFLTSEGHLVFDPFAGSNTTGAIAAMLGRKWISIEAREDYALGSRGRFMTARKAPNDSDRIVPSTSQGGRRVTG
ncbi:MAG: site-specific DNA-methyltransferase [Acidobacteriaceae bacterium]